MMMNGNNNYFFSGTKVHLQYIVDIIFQSAANTGYITLNKAKGSCVGLPPL